MASLLKVVPHILMEPFPNYAAILPGALPAFLAADVDDIDAALGYIGGALAHQDCMANETVNMVSKVFKGVITDVTYVERKSGDYVLGKKAIIHFTAQKNGSDDAQDISTDWFEYRSYNPELESFWVALSQTVVAVALENIGNECLIRKSFKAAETANGGSSVRYVASITPVAGGKKTAIKENAPKSSSRSKPARDEEDDDDDDSLTVSAVTKMIEADKSAGAEYDDADPKVAKKVAKIVTDAMNEVKFDDQYDKFADGLDLTKISKALQASIEDALEEKTDKKVAAALFIIGIEELG